MPWPWSWLGVSDLWPLTPHLPCGGYRNYFLTLLYLALLVFGVRTLF